jgi:hypothetical protein
MIRRRMPLVLPPFEDRLSKAVDKGGLRGEYKEPAPDLTMKRLLASFAGHAAGYLAAIK